MQNITDIGETYSHFFFKVFRKTSQECKTALSSQYQTFFSFLTKQQHNSSLEKMLNLYFSFIFVISKNYRSAAKVYLAKHYTLKVFIYFWKVHSAIANVSIDVILVFWMHNICGLKSHSCYDFISNLVLKGATWDHLDSLITQLG